MLPILFLQMHAFPQSYLLNGTLTYEGHGLGEQPGAQKKVLLRNFQGKYRP